MYAARLKSLRTDGIPIRGFGSTAESNLIAAGLASGGVIWTHRNPEANTRPMLLTYLRALTIVVTAFGTPVTAGRGLDLVRLTGPAATSDPSGGNAVVPVRWSSNSSESIGVGRIADTGALTVTGFTASGKLRKHDMSVNGAANNQVSNFWKYDVEEDCPVILPGECIALASSQLMDATGTFRLLVDFSMVELP